MDDEVFRLTSEPKIRRRDGRRPDAVRRESSRMMLRLINREVEPIPPVLATILGMGEQAVYRRLDWARKDLARPEQGAEQGRTTEGRFARVYGPPDTAGTVPERPTLSAQEKAYYERRYRHSDDAAVREWLNQNNVPLRSRP